MKILKWIAIVIGVLLVVLLVAGGTAHLVGSNRLNNAPDVPVATVVAATDADALARGAHLVNVSSCNECHGRNLEGTVFVDEAPIGYIPAPNLTAGAGGVGSAYTDEDWARAIRHGVAADGRALAIMPSNHYAHYGDEDLAALIGYLATVPPVDNDLGTRRIDFPGTIIFGLLGYQDVAAVAKTDHAAVGGAAPEKAASAEYGEYLVNLASCNSCHGETLTGATDPSGPQGPNITPAGALGAYDATSFAQALQTGLTPDGRTLSTEMPWLNYADLDDTEVQALWAYLNTLSTP